MGKPKQELKRPAEDLRDIKKRLDTLADVVLTELNPYKRLRQLVSFDGKTLQCGGSEVPIKTGSRIIAVGAGKAALPMARALHDIFGNLVHGVVIYHKDLGQLPALGNIRFQPGGHPNPDEGSINGAKAIIQCLEDAGCNDIVFSLISGGGSAMMELPVPGVSLEDYIAANELLNRAGVDIEKWNAVRKHLSEVKGGKLARYAAHAAKIFNLMVSDVKDDRPDVIASGPFAADPSTFAEAYDVLIGLVPKARKLGIEIPSTVMNYLKDHLGVDTGETLKTPPANVVNMIVAGNQTAIALAREQLKIVGVACPRITCLANVSGEVTGVTDHIYSHLEALIKHQPGVPAAVIAGGEATVDVSRYPGYRAGESFGGRMQMMAAMMIPRLEGLPVTGLFLATDCRDGTAPPGEPGCAGALIDGAALKECEAKNIPWEKFIQAGNTYRLHRLLSTQLRKDSCETNVMDLVVLVYWPLAPSNTPGI